MEIFKNIFRIVSFTMMVHVACFAQQPVQIMGSLYREHRDIVKLFKVADGRTVEIASSKINSDKKFGFIFYPDYEGVYVLGTGSEHTPRENHVFYLKDGDQLELSISDTSYTLTGNLNSKENRIIEEWKDLTNPLYQKAINLKGNSTFVDYFPQQEKIVTLSQTFLNGKTTDNPNFNKQIKDIIKLDLINFAMNFLNTPRSVHPRVEEYSDFYSSIEMSELTRSTYNLYHYPYGISVLSALVKLKLRQGGKFREKDSEGLKIALSYISNDTLKGDVILETLSRYKDYESYSSTQDEFGKYLLTEAQKDKNDKKLVSLISHEPGSRSYPFAYPDANGKIVTMESFRGKVVLIDVWATWCGPCRAQFPHLKTLEEDFKGTDLQILGISVDEDKDKEKWKKMIVEKELGGVQLFASGWSDITKYYKITGIPRFMVFDKEGKIVTVDAPRPSDPKLKALLKDVLDK